MRKYEAPQAQVVNFENDFVVAGWENTPNKSDKLGKSCGYVKDSTSTGA